MYIKKVIERSEKEGSSNRYTRKLVTLVSKLESSSGSPHSLLSFPLFARLPPLSCLCVLACFPAVKWKLEISA